MYYTPRRRNDEQTDSFNVSDIRSSLFSSAQSSSSNAHFSLAGLQTSLDNLESLAPPLAPGTYYDHDEVASDTSMHDVNMFDVSYSTDISVDTPAQNTYMGHVYSNNIASSFPQYPSHMNQPQNSFIGDITTSERELIPDVEMLDYDPVYDQQQSTVYTNNSTHDLPSLYNRNIVDSQNTYSRNTPDLLDAHEPTKNTNLPSIFNNKNTPDLSTVYNRQTQHLDHNGSKPPSHVDEGKDNSEVLDPPPSTNRSIFQTLKNKIFSSKPDPIDTPDLIDLSDDTVPSPPTALPKPANFIPADTVIDQKESKKDITEPLDNLGAQPQSPKASRLLFSPTIAGAELALYNHPIAPVESHENTNPSKSVSQPPVDANTDTFNFDDTNKQMQHLSLPTPTPAWISAMANHLRHQQTLSVAEQKESHKRQRMVLAPYVISSYFQLFSNIALAALIAYGLVCGYLALKHDVIAKLVERRSNIIQEASRCASEYVRNECRNDVRVPMMQESCQQWEACIEKALVFMEGGYSGIPVPKPGYDSAFDESLTFEDPVVPHSDFSVAEIQRIAGMFQRNGHHDTLSHFAYIPAVAETLADIANSFFEPVTIKTLCMFVVLVFGSVYVSNFAFGYLRARTFYGAYGGSNGEEEGAEGMGNRYSGYNSHNEAYHQPAYDCPGKFNQSRKEGKIKKLKLL